MVLLNLRTSSYEKHTSYLCSFIISILNPQRGTAKYIYIGDGWLIITELWHCCLSWQAVGNFRTSDVLLKTASFVFRLYIPRIFRFFHVEIFRNSPCFSPDVFAIFSYAFTQPSFCSSSTSLWIILTCFLNTNKVATEGGVKEVYRLQNIFFN